MTMRTMVLVAGAATSLMVMGCEEKQNAGTGAGNAITKAADSATKAAGDATKAVGETATKGLDAAKDAGAKVADGAKDAASKAEDMAKDAAKGATDAAKGAMEKLKAEASTWMSDVVEKQWPAAKSTLDAASKKVADIKAPDVKTKAEGLVKDLQGSIPGIEETVGKLKNFTGTDMSSLLSEAKTKVEGFMSKLGDLKKMVGM
jgi:hypothetical protein